MGCNYVLGRYQGMNPKFFDVKKEKQDAIINAALMVFAENGYRKASTDVMVKEAGISKGLLFHYFISKQGVYEFVYDYSVKYMMLELVQTVRRDERDFFSIQRMIELAKTRVMKNYPYMQQFLSSVKYENHPDALKVISESDKVIDDTYNSIYKKVDMSRFNGPVDLQKIIRMIGWMSDGYIKDKFREGTPDLDEMNAEFAQYLSMLRDHFYGGGTKPAVQPVTPSKVEEEVERDDSVMDSMRDAMLQKPAQDQPEEKTRELSFEERLALGKKPAYDMEPAEEEIPKDDDQGSLPDDTAAEEEVREAEEEPAAEDKDIIEEEMAEAGEEGASEEEAAEEKEEAAAAEEESALSEKAEEATAEKEEASAEEGEVQAEEEKETEKADADEPFSEPDDNSEEISQDDRTEEVTISVDSFSTSYRDYDNYGSMAGEMTYAASPSVASYVPGSDLSVYEESRLGDFTYGSDARGGRGIPYDSSENIQIFVTEDYEEPVPEANENGESFDISDLSEKIMSNTDRETAEAERNRELESMGPAPVLPDFSPENIKNKTSQDDDDEDSHIYRPLKF